MMDARGRTGALMAPANPLGRTRSIWAPRGPISWPSVAGFLLGRPSVRPSGSRLGARLAVSRQPAAGGEERSERLRNAGAGMSADR